MKKSGKSTIRNLDEKLQTQKVDFLETFTSGDRNFFQMTADLQPNNQQKINFRIATFI